MYQHDSFFGLSGFGQVGLACLSALLLILMIMLTHIALKHRAIWMRIIGALVLFYLFIWLSPQIYYMYYRMIIPDLPLQIVIKSPHSPVIVLQYLFFQGPHNLSAHGQGLLGWWLIVAPFLKWPLQSDKTRQTPQKKPG